MRQQKSAAGCLQVASRAIRLATELGRLLRLGGLEVIVPALGNSEAGDAGHRLETMADASRPSRATMSPNCLKGGPKERRSSLEKIFSTGATSSPSCTSTSPRAVRTSRPWSQSTSMLRLPHAGSVAQSARISTDLPCQVQGASERSGIFWHQPPGSLAKMLVGSMMLVLLGTVLGRIL